MPDFTLCSSILPDQVSLSYLNAIRADHAKFSNFFRQSYSHRAKLRCIMWTSGIFLPNVDNLQVPVRYTNIFLCGNLPPCISAGFKGSLNTLSFLWPLSCGNATYISLSQSPSLLRPVSYGNVTYISIFHSPSLLKPLSSAITTCISIYRLLLSFSGHSHVLMLPVV